MNVGLLGNVIRKIAEFGAKNSTTILTVCAVGGVAGTAVSTGKAVIKARDIITAHEMDEDLKCEEWEEKALPDGTHEYEVKRVYYRERTFVEKTKLTWKCYISPVLLGTSTIACIVGSNRISTKRNLALAAAYSMSEEAAKEFRDKVVDTIGERKTEKIETEIAQDHVNANPVPDEDHIIYTQYGGQLMYDWWTGRYFRGSQNEIDKKVNMLDKRIRRKKEAATVNDLYELIGLPGVPVGEEWGWNYKPDTDDGDVTIHCRPTCSSQGEPCIEVRINPELLHIYV